jgi:hypothetical protein
LPVGWPWRLLLFTAVVFGTVVFLYFGIVFGYKPFLDSRVKGLDKEIARAARIPVRVADDPLTCVVRGTGILLADMELLNKVISPGSEEL